MIRISMLLTFAMASSPLAAQAFPTDTTVPVERGSRLRVNTMSGDIMVSTWDRNELRVRADHSRRTEVTVDRSGSVVDVTARGRMGLPGTVDYEITAPAWMALELGGMNAEVRIDGTRAAVRVETLQGDIVLRGGTETISLGTTNGAIAVYGAKGRLDLRAIAGDVRVYDSEGDIRVESVSGDAELYNVSSRSVEVQTVSGELVLSGTIADGGTYSLFSHSGDIVLGVPERSNARLTLSSANGEIDLGFQLQAEQTSRRRQTYRLGDGSATIELETFSGDIRIVRPDQIRRDEREPERRNRPDRPRSPRSLHDPGPDFDHGHDGPEHGPDHNGGTGR